MFKEIQTQHISINPVSTLLRTEVQIILLGLQSYDLVILKFKPTISQSFRAQDECYSYFISKSGQN